MYSRLLLLITLPAAWAWGNADPADPAPPPDPIRQAWQDASLSLFRDAYRQFQTLDGPEAQLGEALTLLLQQPKTDRNVNNAAAILTELAARSPADEISISARYHLGRLEQIHRTNPDRAAARAHFHTLIAEHPGHPYTEQAVVKLGILELYERVSDEERRTRFQALEGKLAQLQIPSARRDLGFILSDAALRFEYGSETALRNLLVAEEAGIVRSIEQAHAWVRIGELARDVGQHDLARTYYTKFLDTYQRDVRRLMIRQRLEALPPSTSADSRP